MTPTLLGHVEFPHHERGGFDHRDVRRAASRMFVARTVTGNLEILDDERLTHVASVLGCPEASDILCEQGQGRVFAAARGSGRIPVLDAASGDRAFVA